LEVLRLTEGMSSLFQKISNSSFYPYLAPFFLFGIFLSLESLHPLVVYAVYPVKTFCVGILILTLLPRLPSLAVSSWGGSLLVGGIGFALWAGLDPLWVKHGDHSGFNPYHFGEGSMAWGLMAFRLIGAVLVVPVMEELFWRGFLMRYVIAENFEGIALGTFRWGSFIITTAAFASVHGSQWSLAVVVGVLFGGWFVWRKSLGDVIVAHAVTNLALGLYVIRTGKWYFW
jgi:CAAX prenyl protease-like protein